MSKKNSKLDSGKGATGMIMLAVSVDPPQKKHDGLCIWILHLG